MLVALALTVLLAAATPAPRPGEPISEPVHENALVGELGLPPDAARHPAVIVLGGFDCGIPGEAFAFARQGYVGFAVAYCGAAPLPNAADQIAVESVSRAIDWLSARPNVDPKRIGVLGVSQGSALALLAAARDARIKSVAVVSPTAYVWFSPAFDGAADRSSWTLNSGPLPYLAPDQRAQAALAAAYRSGGTFAFRDLYDPSFAAASAAAVASATIPVERIAAPVLCVAGGDDREWDSAGACRTIAARRRDARSSAGDETAIEPGAGHMFTLGGRPSGDVIPAGKMKIRIGGSLEANSRGGADAWNRTLTFFARTL